MVESVGRVFAAVPVPGDARIHLVEGLRHFELPGRAVPPENWHVTLRFLGEVQPTAYERFLHGLDEVSGLGGFSLRLEDMGAFPNPRRAAVVWVGIGAGATELADLAAIAEEAAVDAGLDPEERPFRPHLTLARVRPPADATRLVGEHVDIGWHCDRVVVYRSLHGPGGARYDPLETFPLGR